MVFARSAAMAFNRLADRRFDAANPRTAGRHLPAGRLSVAAVWLFTLVCALGFIASTLLFLPFGNPWPLYLAFIDRPEGIIGRVQYNPDLFEIEAIERLLDDLQLFFETICP